jgi:hypothetical protein
VPEPVWDGELVRSYLAAGGWDGAWKAVVDQLEREYERGEDDVRELLAVSFLEHLPYPGQEGADVVEHLGPALLAELRRLRAGSARWRHAR